MKEEFFRFPHTPHIAWLGVGTPRDDKVMSQEEVRDLLSGPVVVEEKLDGANLGISNGPNGRLRAQNRGQYLTELGSGQFRRLPDWLALHGKRLSDDLGDQLIAFGEWCAARHSLDYISLPDWWLLFDVYDRRAGKFWSTRRRNAWAAAAGLATVPSVADGVQTLAGLRLGVESWMSRYRPDGLEGVVVRREDERWLLNRGKIVRSDFAQAMEVHWRKRKLEWNRVRWDSD